MNIASKDELNIFGSIFYLWWKGLTYYNVNDILDQFITLKI